MHRLKYYLKFLHSIVVVSRSRYFDTHYYIENNPDLGKIYKLFPSVHYCLYGWKEYRDPCLEFNTRFYLNRYSDVESANINPLYHYECSGKYEKRLIKAYPGEDLATTIGNSIYYDNNWYVNTYLFGRYEISPMGDLGRSINIKNPGPIFNSMEYHILSPDVALHNLAPIVHYSGFGRFDNRPVALTELKQHDAPMDAVNIKNQLMERKSYDKKIITVLAVFSAIGKIEDFQVYLLKNLNKISDYIIVVGDNPIYKEELKKLDGLCNAYEFIRHEEYDFGSYKRGYNHLMEQNIMQNDDSLLLINDSNYGPVYPFDNVIDDFKNKECDFYGLISSINYEGPFIQSFFYILKAKVYNSIEFKEFINSVKKQLTPAMVVVNYEYGLSKLLTKNFSPALFIPVDANVNGVQINTKYGHTLISQYKYPLLKRKAVQGATIENMNDTLEYIKGCNKELYDIIIKRENINGYKREKYIDIPSKYLLLSNYAKKEQEIREKVKNGEKINVIFLAYSDETFIAHRVMRKMMDDSTYCVKLYFIPDLRHGHHMAALTYMEKFKLFKEKYPNAEQVIDNVIDKYVEAKYNDKDKFFSMLENTKRELVIENEKEYIKEKCFDGFRNVIKDGDVVFYPHVQDISFSLYNPYYAVRLNKLSVYIPHEIYLYKYDRNYYRMDNFNNFWKVFLDSQISYYEYKQYGQCQAINAEIIGLDSNYYKCNDERKDNKRTKIVIAPYFSIHNGRKMLNSYVLENYGKELFQLPVKYPNIDFIYMFSDALNNMLLNTENKEIKEIDIYKNNLKDYSNALVCGEQDYKNLLLSSSAVILDSGTLFTDAVILNIPCLYIVKDIEQEKKKFNEIGYYMYDAIYKAENVDEIYSFLNNVTINNKDTMKEKRSNVLHTIKLNYSSDSGIADYLKKLLCD